eukprot:tig00021037_g17407.t1
MQKSLPKSPSRPASRSTRARACTPESRPATQRPAAPGLLEDEDYLEGGTLDRLKATSYAHLDAQAHTYLDFTGGGLACQSQLKRLFDFLQNHVLGNPHSMSPTSNLASSLEADARKAVRVFFNVPDDYAVVFTPNASGAMRIIAECYAFGPGVPFLLSADNHNSVGGIREFARAKGSSVTYVPLDDELSMDEEFLKRALREKPAGQHGLFAYPAQSNVSGVKHPLAYTAAAREAGWDVLLDASAFVPTSTLDVAKWRPDFMFGFPTGIGCLLLRREAAKRLPKPYFAGGTVLLVTQATDFHILEPNPDRLHADGTTSYQMLPGVTIGLDFLSHHLAAIDHRLFAILKHVMPAMAALRHPRTGRPLVKIFGPGPDADLRARRRGATIVFNLFDAEGRGVYFGLVEKLAAERGISLRTGCFCNPGCMEKILGLKRETLLAIEQRWRREKAAGAEGHPDVYTRITDGLIPVEGQGAVRVSFGITSTALDASRLLHFLDEFLDESFVARERRKLESGGSAPAYACADGSCF